MRQIKIIFENLEKGEEQRFGYIIDKNSMSYQTVHFDKRYEPFKVFETNQIGNLTIFGKSIWRLIRMALSGGKSGNEQGRTSGVG